MTDHDDSLFAKTIGVFDVLDKRVNERIILRRFLTPDDFNVRFELDDLELIDGLTSLVVLTLTSSKFFFLGEPVFLGDAEPEDFLAGDPEAVRAILATTLPRTLIRAIAAINIVLYSFKQTEGAV